jgi:hypothetical protein
MTMDHTCSPKYGEQVHANAPRHAGKGSLSLGKGLVALDYAVPFTLEKTFSSRCVDTHA